MTTLSERELVIDDEASARVVLRADTAPDVTEAVVSGGSIEFIAYNARHAQVPRRRVTDATGLRPAAPRLASP